MATTDIVGYACASGANVLTQAAYLTTGYANGMSSGIVPSGYFNKALRQASFMAAGLAQFCVNQNVSVLDDGNVTTLASEITSALNALSNTSASGFNNLVAQQTGNSTVNLSVAEISLENSSGVTIRASSISQTLNCAGTGANGLDTGALGVSTFYYGYEIAVSATSTACLASLSAPNANGTYSGSNMPSGYTYSRHITCFQTDGSSHIQSYYQRDRSISILGNTTNIFTNKSPNVNGLTLQSIAAAVPSVAKSVSGYFYCNFASGSITLLSVSTDSSGTGQQSGGINSSSTITGATSTYLNFTNLLISTPQTLYLNFSNSSGGVNNGMAISSYNF